MLSPSVHNFLGNLGYTGTTNDRLHKYLRDSTGRNGTVDDLLYYYLGTQNFTGSLSDRIAAVNAAGLVLPAKSFDFTAGTLPSGLTYTNSSTTRTYFGSDGLIKTAAANEPIFEYNPVTRALLGMRWEMEQRTNYLRNSGDFTQSQWAVAGGTKTGGQPDSRGGNAATLIAGPSVGVPTQTITAAVSGAHSLSIVCKGVTGTASVELGLRNNTTATLDTIAVVNPITGQIISGPGWTSVAVGNGFFKYTKTTTVTITAGDTLALYFGRTSILPSGWNLVCDYAQLEAGSSASSYIPTAGSAVIRQPDVLTASSISPWYNQSEGTVVFEGISTDLSASRGIFVFSDGTNTERQYANLNASGAFVSTVNTTAGGLQSAITTANVTTTSSIFRVSHAYKVNQFGAVLNGGVVGTDVSGSLPSPNQLKLGAVTVAGAFPFMGYARRFSYYNTRLPNSQIQGLSRV